jgi:ABC-type Fe3+-hydroxamate transport system substrate-binding protein
MQVKDQIGNNIYLKKYPGKIVSLVPSKTELLYDLGLSQRVIGITKFCIYPKNWKKEKTIVGGTKNIDVEKIISLKPDLIIANKEENLAEEIFKLQTHFPVFVSDISDLKDSIEMINLIGKITNAKEKAKAITNKIYTEFSKVIPFNPPQKVAYFIWRSPYMVAANNTFINSILSILGFQNIFSDLLRYPEVTIEMLKERKPQLIFLSSEPYPFKELHKAEFEKYFPKIPVLMVDGEMFSWYGSRLIYTPAYLNTLKARITTLSSNTYC